MVDVPRSDGTIAVLPEPRGRRLLDMVIAVTGLTVAAPILAPVCVLVWLQDGKSPFYIASRVGRGGEPFRMVKLRSMLVGADRTGVDSTAADDDRVTPVGHLIRRYKLDEFTQLWNVARGDMSLVGPRPNVERETSLYTTQEQRLLSVRPGITDFSSIVFSDLARILAGHDDPNIGYNQLVRPWKNRLGLFYIDHRSMSVDMRLIVLTLMSIVSRTRALRGVEALLKRLGADAEMMKVATRRVPLVPTPPPGADEIVTSRTAMTAA